MKDKYVTDNNEFCEKYSKGPPFCLRISLRVKDFQLSIPALTKDLTIS